MNPWPSARTAAGVTVSLAGRRALVTGAATGIGRATALRLAQAGALVWINHLGQTEQARGLLDEIAAIGGQARAVEADVGSAAEVQRMAGQIGALDILVNNAGILQDKPFLETTEADWDRVLTVDLKGVFLVSQALMPILLERPDDPGRACIVNIASDLGLLGRGRYAAYCAAKAGVIGLTKALAREFAPQLRVNAVAPGPVATAMVSAEHMSPEWLEKELDIPQHRLADPGEVADTVLFLASDLARFYTGQVLGPNGGSVMP
ncbi:3-oxoacyl-ACP reductase family protein [Hydrogenophaga sp. IBVHS2]|uniref:3-oxoacyl-ACP reductase family protein n=1 Tax=Hydrogenophaga sp. IBVHS2 TaxID=1985170 RepID=UPI000A2E5F29|nr:3-oxoacyl-ACP reductase family protein [Hydrogenophaga sp. IBVHS2]OSZ65414.1 short-chain dehydrogenase [Hydrogenophaga sp. IBVHS2]